MKHNINEINHNFIIKMVIFSLFLFKRHLRDPEVYNDYVNTFIKKRIIWDIEFYMKPIIVDKAKDRESILNYYINGDKSWMDSQIHIVSISFKTPMRFCKMDIDMRNELEYEKFIYQ